jgi:putative transposase
VIKTLEGGETISRIMQYIKARIAEIYNRINHCTGSFWNERFRSEIIENMKDPVESFLRLLWYLSYHAIESGDMKNPRDNPFSSIHAYLGLAGNSIIPISCHEYYEAAGSTSEEKIDFFGKYETESSINGSAIVFLK